MKSRLIRQRRPRPVACESEEHARTHPSSSCPCSRSCSHPRPFVPRSPQPASPGPSSQGEANRQCQAMSPYRQCAGETAPRIPRLAAASGIAFTGFPRIYAISSRACIVLSCPPLSFVQALATLLQTADRPPRPLVPPLANLCQASSSREPPHRGLYATARCISMPRVSSFLL